MSEAFNKNMPSMREVIHSIQLLATSSKFWLVLFNAVRSEGKKEKTENANPSEMSSLPERFYFSKAGFSCSAILL